jgi:hypothetical protein
MVSKLRSVMLSATLLASCFAACEADAKAKRLPGAQLASFPVTGSSQANSGQGSPAHQKAMAECLSQYGGQRFWLNRDRYAYIEQCFMMATGKYPHQVQADCHLRFRGGQAGYC